VYKNVYTKTAVMDIPKLKAAHLDAKAKALIEVIREHLYQTPPSYEKLVDDFQGLYFRRINVQHRLDYQVLEEGKPSKSSACGLIMRDNHFSYSGVSDFTETLFVVGTKRESGVRPGVFNPMIVQNSN